MVSSDQTIRMLFLLTAEPSRRLDCEGSYNPLVCLTKMSVKGTVLDAATTPVPSLIDTKTRVSRDCRRLAQDEWTNGPTNCKRCVKDLLPGRLTCQIKGLVTSA